MTKEGGIYYARTSGRGNALKKNQMYGLSNLGADLQWNATVTVALRFYFNYYVGRSCIVQT
jgi:GTP cyclohydrolase II